MTHDVTLEQEPRARRTVPADSWFRRDKYGLFIHFGLYALLAGEYQGRPIPGLAEWIMHSAKIPLTTYRKLAERFAPDAFDADAICRRAKAWGMRYVCLTSKHHDGFALFDSKVSDYTSVKAPNCRRDLVGELAEACRAHDLKFCLYYSQAQDWEHPEGFVADGEAPRDFRRYLDEKCLPQIRELLTNYGELSMIWFDTPMGMTKEESAEVAATVKAIQPDCLISGRIGNHLGDYITTQDNRIPAYPIETPWEIPATLNHTWGYDRHDEDWATPEEILGRLLRIVSRGGNYLLNVGPKADGSIPEGSLPPLDGVGAWLETAGESVYGTEPLPLYVYEAPELIMTHKPHHLYLHVLDPVKYASGHIPIPNIANTVRDARWLQLPDADVKLHVGKNLEGDPFWGLSLPEDTSAYADLPALTLAIETEEAAFVQLPLDRGYRA